MKTDVKADAKRRLARIAGQVAGVQKMVESDRSCSDILQQIQAIRAAVDQLGVVYLTEHLQTCVLHQGNPSDGDYCQDLPEDKRSEEIRQTLTRFLK
jgi:CsoR family transcriptional regulator, copper-sensing transcriptional repressor